ncbi:MAG: Fur family transcriptional regulator [Verrucomicrobiota bacterium JB024]|nr:Fur family transcriptional regulator [Verrucomicrobiota bacterium JB024]
MPKRKDSLLESLIRCIRESPLRLTKKRELILSALLTSDRPVSAMQIRERASLPEGDLVTVYRTLEAFLTIGIVQRVPLENGACLYEVTAPHDHHHHFVCRCCHKTERLDLCLSDELERRAQAIGFKQVAHVMEVYGVCPECEEAQASGH